MEKMTIEENWNKFLFGVGNDFTNELVKTVPVDKGMLKNSINFRVQDDTVVFEMNETGKFVEFGTPPHIIRVKNKKVLSDGKVFFGKQVNHPGTRPNPFIRNALNAKFPQIIQDNVERHLK